MWILTHTFKLASLAQGMIVQLSQWQWSSHREYEENRPILNYNKNKPFSYFVRHGPFAWYVKLRVAHAPGVPAMFFTPPRVTILTCITACAWRTCKDACRDRQLMVSFEVGGGENVPGILGVCATRNITYQVRGPKYRWVTVEFATAKYFQQC